MKRIFKILGFLVLFLAFVIAVFLVFGLMTPAKFSGSMAKEVNLSTQQIWDQMNDIESLPKHRKEIEMTEVIDRNPNGEVNVWKEYLEDGKYIIFEVIERSPISKKTIKIREANAGLLGTWSYELESRGANKTFMRITENSEATFLPLRSFLFFKGREYFMESDFDFWKTMESELNQ